MKKIFLTAAFLAAAYFAVAGSGVITPDTVRVSNSTSASDETLARAFSERLSGFQAEGTGIVIKILSDDNDGGRHQRFIIRLETGQTLLIAHNIDLAERVEDLRTGDSVEFSGEYEWNRQGGVIHWTHRDPSGSHLSGWIEHNGQRYW